MKAYDRGKAVEYAKKWALSYNPAFYHFGGIGGDCTNYISQCLLAGGGIMNYDYINGWFYHDVARRSPSWTSVAYLQRYLLRSSGVGPVAEICDLSEVEAGDLIQLRQNDRDFNHTLFVSDVRGGDVFVCAHSNDAKDKRLGEYLYKELMALRIIGIKI